MQPTIESLLLADFAEVINGKLYVMGAGFTQVHMASLQQAHRFYLASAFRVPFSYSDEGVPFSVRLESLDAEPLDCWSMEGQLETTRTPGQRDGDTVTMFAVPVDVMVPEPMDVVLRFRFGEDERTTRFRVLVASDPPPEEGGAV